MRSANAIKINGHAVAIVGQAVRLPNNLFRAGARSKSRRERLMDPYAKPNERRVGANRPKISHLPADVDHRTRSRRRAEKQAVVAKRRAIKKAARQQLKGKLRDELEES